MAISNPKAKQFASAHARTADRRGRAVADHLSRGNHLSASYAASESWHYAQRALEFGALSRKGTAEWHACSFEGEHGERKEIEHGS